MPDKSREYVESNYICHVIKGTTFSGHPSKTTFGNTLRSLCYAYYYLHLAGLDKPWNNDYCDVIAAGDDVVIFVHPRYVDRVVNSIMINSSRFKGTESQFGADGVACGLGQCIK